MYKRQLESVLEDFAVRSEDEDIAYFVRVLTVARKSGGSLSSIIRHTADTMNLRMEINSEIETILAGKRGEWRIMLIVPPGILCYMNMCSSEYMNTVSYTHLIFCTDWRNHRTDRKLGPGNLLSR